jgi:adenosylhomocysteine nucleosidase
MVPGAWVRAFDMKRIGIIAALPAELKPLVQGWKQERSGRGDGVWRRSVDQISLTAVCCGMGPAAAQRACDLAGPQDALVSVGWAGALSCGMRPGEAYTLNEIVDAMTGERFPTDSPARTGNAGPLRIVTVDHVALPAEKRQLGETYQAVLVDMEAATVGRVARRQGSEFYCLKAVSDVAGERLPDFNRFTDDQGHLQLAAFVPYVAIRPQYWPALARVAGNAKAGAVAIATAVQPLLRNVGAKGNAEVFG